MKRKHITAICIAVSVLAALTVITVVAQAQPNDPTVVLDGAANQFFFRNVSPYQGNKYPNLFKDNAFTAMMPGDAVKEEIVVKAENLSGCYADIYLSAETRNDDITAAEAADFQKLMQNATITITRSGSNSSVGLPADGRVQLGTFHENDTVTIAVNLGINKDAGNDLQNLKAEIGWVFRGEIYPYGGGGGGGGGSGAAVEVPPKSEIYFPGERDVLPPEHMDAPALNDTCHFGYIQGRSDGLIHPEADITRAEVAAIFFRLLTDESRAYYWAESNPYSDVLTDYWCNREISTLTNAGILQGYPDGTFRPGDTVTRAQFVVICARFSTYKAQGKTFPDIQGHWAQSEIEQISAKGILTGYADGMFRPDQPITRAELIVLTNRMMGRTPKQHQNHEDMIRWPDNMDTTAWYYADIQEATNSHLHAEEENTFLEQWAEVVPPPDWNALGERWSKLYTSPAPTMIVDSRSGADYR